MRQQLVVISGPQIYLGAPEAVMAGGPDGAPVESLCQTQQPVKSYATHGKARTPAGAVFWQQPTLQFQKNIGVEVNLFSVRPNTEGI